MNTKKSYISHVLKDNRIIVIQYTEYTRKKICFSKESLNEKDEFLVCLPQTHYEKAKVLSKNIKSVKATFI